MRTCRRAYAGSAAAPPEFSDGGSDQPMVDPNAVGDGLPSELRLVGISSTRGRGCLSFRLALQWFKTKCNLSRMHHGVQEWESAVQFRVVTEFTELPQCHSRMTNLKQDRECGRDVERLARLIQPPTWPA